MHEHYVHSRGKSIPSNPARRYGNRVQQHNNYYRSYFPISYGIHNTAFCQKNGIQSDRVANTFLYSLGFGASLTLQAPYQRCRDLTYASVNEMHFVQQLQTWRGCETMTNTWHSKRPKIRTARALVRSGFWGFPDSQVVLLKFRFKMGKKKRWAGKFWQYIHYQIRHGSFI